MKKPILLCLLLLTGCVTTDPNPIATSLQEASAKDDYMLCQNKNRGGSFETEIIEERKLNCTKVFESRIKLLMASASAPELCTDNLNNPNKWAKAEITKRGLNCDKVLAAYYQEQQILAQQEAADAHRQAAAAAWANAFKPQPKMYPTNTNCYTAGRYMNCSSY